MIVIFYHHDRQGRAGLLVPWMVVTFLFLVYDLVSLTIAIIILITILDIAIFVAINIISICASHCILTIFPMAKLDEHT